VVGVCGRVRDKGRFSVRGKLGLGGLALMDSD